MSTGNFLNDTVLFSKAFLSNQIAHFAPSLYVKLTKQTGRGEEQTATETANYFIQCFDDYFKYLKITESERENWLQEKTILEYGPGDILGVALLLYAHGANNIQCVDRFPLSNNSKKNLAIYEAIINSLDGDKKDRAQNAFLTKGKPESGFNPNAIRYVITKDGLSGESRLYDLIISRAVLEHVNNLKNTIKDIYEALKPNGISVHQVDLKSHGLDRYQDFDFLTWPDPLYNLMYSHKGFPNRWRVNHYEKFIKESRLTLKHLEATGKLSSLKIGIIKNFLAKRFHDTSLDELSWLGFWMVLEKEGLDRE